MTKGKRKCKNGRATISVPLNLHKFITKAGEKAGLSNYELVHKMAQAYAPLFCPELLKYLSNE